MHCDQQLAQFVAAYPEARRQRGYMVEQLFLHALSKVSFETLIAALEQHKRSDQWATARMIPSLRTWLEEERWIQVLPEPEVPASRLTPWEHARRAGLK
jgi:hypothetical protein